jgi:uncharacterized protein (DUF2147 family)
MKRGKLMLVLSLLAVGTSIGVGMAAMSPRAPAATDPSAAMGRWLTESGNLEVDIAPCGAALCGTVVAVRANRSMSHPDREMKPADGRSPMGMQILTGFVATGDGSWTGRIYNRENGRTYDCQMTALPDATLRVRGYKLFPLIGRSQVWTRIAAVQTAAGVH